MAPLLKPSECSVLVLDGGATADARRVDKDTDRNRGLILQASTICNVPTFLAVRNPSAASPLASSVYKIIQGLSAVGASWADTPLGQALAAASRPSLLICGYWLDECITFSALNALAEGYDVYLLSDASPPLDTEERHMAILRLVQAGIVPTTTRQAIREWAACILDADQRELLLALL